MIIKTTFEDALVTVRELIFLKIESFFEDEKDKELLKTFSRLLGKILDGSFQELNSFIMRLNKDIKDGTFNKDELYGIIHDFRYIANSIKGLEKDLKKQNLEDLFEKSDEFKKGLEECGVEPSQENIAIQKELYFEVLIFISNEIKLVSDILEVQYLHSNKKEGCDEKSL